MSVVDSRPRPTETELVRLRAAVDHRWPELPRSDRAGVERSSRPHPAPGRPLVVRAGRARSPADPRRACRAPPPEQARLRSCAPGACPSSASRSRTSCHRRGTARAAARGGRGRTADGDRRGRPGPGRPASGASRDEAGRRAARLPGRSEGPGRRRARPGSAAGPDRLRRRRLGAAAARRTVPGVSTGCLAVVAVFDKRPPSPSPRTTLSAAARRWLWAVIGLDAMCIAWMISMGDWLDRTSQLTAVITLGGHHRIVLVLAAIGFVLCAALAPLTHGFTEVASESHRWPSRLAGVVSRSSRSPVFLSVLIVADRQPAAWTGLLTRQKGLPHAAHLRPTLSRSDLPITTIGSPGRRSQQPNAAPRPARSPRRPPDIRPCSTPIMPASTGPMTAPTSPTIWKAAARSPLPAGVRPGAKHVGNGGVGRRIDQPGADPGSNDAARRPAIEVVQPSQSAGQRDDAPTRAAPAASDRGRRPAGRRAAGWQRCRPRVPPARSRPSWPAAPSTSTTNSGTSATRTP